MSALARALVVGAGVAGSAAAVGLRRIGVEVDLVERMPEPTALGSGITLQGNALRALEELGVRAEVERAGYPHDELVVRAPDPAATALARTSTARTGGPDLPATLGILRPELARILLARAAGLGARARYATTVAFWEPDEAGVDVVLSDGDTARYDLVIGADGLRSQTRRMLGIDLATRRVGLGVWRVTGPRPSELTCTEHVHGGAFLLAGLCPTGEKTCYAYLVERARDRLAPTPAERLETVRAQVEGYHGPWDEFRPAMLDPAALTYTWFESHLLPGPWNRGRVVLIGDAAHSFPPILNQGAAMGLEDAVVLVDLLGAAAAVDDALWSAFTRRRSGRVGAVAAATDTIADWMLQGVRGDVAGLRRELGELLAHPA